MTITIGWWALPALVTVVLCVWVAREPYPGDYVMPGRPLIAVPLALIAWLIWALAT